jgi:hypothetical protein
VKVTLLVISPDSEFLAKIALAALECGFKAETYESFARVPQPFPLNKFDAAICEHDLGTVPAIRFLEALDVALGDSFKVFPIVVVAPQEAFKSLRAAKWPLAVRRVIPKALSPKTIVTFASLEASAAKAVDVWSS